MRHNRPVCPKRDAPLRQDDDFALYRGARSL
jgi:hypothetical protein